MSKIREITDKAKNVGFQDAQLKASEIVSSYVDGKNPPYSEVDIIDLSIAILSMERDK